MSVDAQAPRATSPMLTVRLTIDLMRSADYCCSRG
ncbi:hypothetical protein SAMN05216251_11333 [Actinacidiphila alni]|uniref:Uncharacterized protein n=1 Tax=Actinacidiphila alni TaxID=380248 RepID=A0A1I2IG07_9ACTN|nr:hypothetical protein SAMN05216251_11333 [Actinacidiphila alni]